MAKKQQKLTQEECLDLQAPIDPSPASAMQVRVVTDSDVNEEIKRRYGNIHNNTIDALKAILRELVMARMQRG
jgi:hypothetical protein